MLFAFEISLFHFYFQSALPDATFKRRPASGHNQDKSKRESLDIQTLAKMQEQSLRDSLEAVRKGNNNIECNLNNSTIK